jgi:hypothetical protein
MLAPCLTLLQAYDPTGQVSCNMSAQVHACHRSMPPTVISMFAITDLTFINESWICSTLRPIADLAEKHWVPNACITSDQPLFIKAVGIVLETDSVGLRHSAYLSIVEVFRPTVTEHKDRPCDRNEMMHVLRLYEFLTAPYTSRLLVQNRWDNAEVVRNGMKQKVEFYKSCSGWQDL